MWRLVLRIRGFRIRWPRFERKNRKCNDVRARKDGEQAPKSTMAGAAQEFNDGHENQKQKHDRHHDEICVSEKRANAHTRCFLHTLLGRTRISELGGYYQGTSIQI